MYQTGKDTGLRKEELIYIEEIFKIIIMLRCSISLAGIDLTVLL